MDNRQLIEKAAAFPCIIWDMDGTILDSMPYWKNLSADYLASKGVSAPSDICKQTETMTMEESATLFQKAYGIELSVSEIIVEVLGMIAEEYRSVIPAKPFATEIIEKAAKNNSRMCVLTTSDRELAQAALDRVGLLKYFEEIFTAEELKLDKRSGKIYEETMQRMGFAPQNTLICEDALYAVRGASEVSGVTVMAFRDCENEGSWAEITEIANLAQE